MGILTLALAGLSALLLVALLRQRSGEHRRAGALAETVNADLAQLALVARKTSNAVIVTDAQRRITWVNAGFERITGYSAAEALGQSPGALLQCADSDAATVQRMREALDAGHGFVGDLINRGQCGRLYWIEFDIQPVHDPAGRLSGFIAIESDISDRKAAEAALRASQAFLHNTGRIAGVGGWAYDLGQDRVEWTEQACTILGMADATTTSVAEFLACFAPEARPPLRAALSRATVSDAPWALELPVPQAGGPPRWVCIMAETAFNDDGPQRLVGALQDVTARRAMQAEVHHSALLLQAAIDASDEAFVLFDPADRLVFCNEKYRALYGAIPGTVVPGASFESIVRQGLRRGAFAAAIGREDAWLAERLAQHRRSQGALVKPLADGRTLRILERRLPDGHLLGFHLDISDLVRATEAAEQANVAKTKFIGTISHELRTPLQSVIGFSELGAHFAHDQPQFQSMFSDILGGGRRMLGLVNALLDVARLEDESTTLATTVDDLTQLAAVVLQALQPDLQRKALQLQWPEPRPALPVQVHTGRIEQVLHHVLANAIRFAPAGSAIEISAREGGAGGALLAVRDHGPGIPDDELDTIFDAFVQSSRTRDGSGGAGLGLTLCRQILRAHGGRITAANADGGGAVFSLWLPPLHRSRGEPAPGQAAAAAIATTAAGPPTPHPQHPAP